MKTKKTFKKRRKLTWLQRMIKVWVLWNGNESIHSSVVWFNKNKKGVHPFLWSSIFWRRFFFKMIKWFYTKKKIHLKWLQQTIIKVPVLWNGNESIHSCVVPYNKAKKASPSIPVTFNLMKTKKKVKNKWIFSRASFHAEKHEQQGQERNEIVVGTTPPEPFPMIRMLRHQRSHVEGGYGGKNGARKNSIAKELRKQSKKNSIGDDMGFLPMSPAQTNNVRRGSHGKVRRINNDNDADSLPSGIGWLGTVLIR